MFGRKKAKLVADLAAARVRIRYLEGIAQSRARSLEDMRRSYEAEIMGLHDAAEFFRQANKALLADKNYLLKRMQGVSAILNGREWKPEEAVTGLCKAIEGEPPSAAVSDKNAAY